MGCLIHPQSRTAYNNSFYGTCFSKFYYTMNSDLLKIAKETLINSFAR